MFADSSRYTAVRYDGESGYEEGIELGMALMREDRKWSRQNRVLLTIPMLEPYGPALKPYLAEMRRYFETYAEWCRANNRAAIVTPAENALERIKAKIAAGEPAPKLKSLSSESK